MLREAAALVVLGCPQAQNHVALLFTPKFRYHHPADGSQAPGHIRLIESAKQLQNGARSDVPDLFGFESWADVVSQARAEDDGPLAAFVDLIEDYGIERLLQAFRRTVDHEVSASLVISTAHRSKGGEWEKVELTDDYVIERIAINGVQHPMPEEELRIAYVAMTRATGEVQLPEGIVRRFNIAVPRERAQVRLHWKGADLMNPRN